MTTDTDKRKVFIDVLRIIACCLVLYNHTDCFNSFKYVEVYNNIYLIVLAIITKINVPVFFLISGILMIGREIPEGKWLRKIGTILIILIFFSTILYLNQTLFAEEKLNFVNLLYRLFSGNDIPGALQYWYLYSYLGYLFTLPFLQIMGKHMEARHFWLLFIGHFIMATVIPFNNFILNIFGLQGITISRYFEIPLMNSGVFFYPLMGYFLENTYSETNLKRKTVIWSFISLVCIMITVALVEYDGYLTGYKHSLIGLFEYVYVFTIYLLVKEIFIKKPVKEKYKRILKTASNATFGIYLLDPLLKQTVSWMLYQDINNFFNTVPLSKAIIWILFSFLVSGMISYLFNYTKNILLKVGLRIKLGEISRNENKDKKF